MHRLVGWCYSAKHHDWGWMLGCWHSAVFRDIFPNVMTWSLCLLMTGSTVNVLSSEKVMIWFPWFFWSFNERVLLSRRFWIVAELNWGLLERLRLFPPIILTILDTVDTEFFSFVTVLSFSGVGHFHLLFIWVLCLYSESFLIENGPLGTLRPSNVVPLDEEPVCWRSAAYPRVGKWIFKFFQLPLADSWRLVTFYKCK